MARRTWAELRTEHIARAGRTGDSAYTARAERMLEGAYRDICHLYYHHALFTEHTALVCVLGQGWVSLPAGVDIVIGFELRYPAVPVAPAVANGFLRQLKGPVPATDLFGRRLELSQALPEYFMRGNAKLYFDRLPDQLYKSVLYYHALPTAPAFGGAATAEIGEVWDERIVEWSVERAQNALWVPDLAAAGGQLLREFLMQMPEPTNSQKPIPERRNAIGGATG